MFEKIILFAKYFTLKKYLMNKLGYTENEAIKSISDIRKMKPDLLKAFLIWFNTGKTPEKSMYGINFDALVKYRELNPVAAFLAVDWYTRDPAAAYTAIAMPQSDNGDSVAFIPKDQIEKIKKKYNIKSRNLETDTSDIEYKEDRN